MSYPSWVNNRDTDFLDVHLCGFARLRLFALCERFAYAS